MAHTDPEFLNVGGRKWEELATDSRLVHMGHNCNHLPLPTTIKEAMLGAIADERWRNYTPPYGFSELRDLFRTELNVPDTTAIVTQGATDAIYQFMSTILKPGDEVIVTDPAWPHIANFARSLAATVVDVPIYGDKWNYKLTPDALRSAISEKTKLVTIIDPLNPIGSHYDADEIERLCHIAEERGLWFLHDSTYRHFAARAHHPAVSYYERAGVALSLSKVCGFAGLRVGALVVHDNLFPLLEQNHISRLGGNWIAQKGAITALRAKDEWLPAILEQNQKNQVALARTIEDTPGINSIIYPSFGNFVAVEVYELGADAETLVKAMLEEGVVIRSGHYTSPRFGGNFVRITTSVPYDYVQRCCEALPRAVGHVRAGLV